jgi:hypothetical protein
MTQSRSLTYDEFLAEAVPCIRRVFANLDPFREPFSTDVPCRMILYRPYLYSLDDDELASLAAAAKSVGDTKFYEVTLTSIAAPIAYRSPNAKDDVGYASDPTYVFFLDEPTMYLERQAPFEDPQWETALVSGSGQWGLLLSHENVAVVGGSERFLSTLLDSFPGVEVLDWEGQERATVPPAEQVRLFLDDVGAWRRADEVWLPAYLTHIYGAEQAETLIRDAVSRPGERRWRFPHEQISRITGARAKKTPAISPPIGASKIGQSVRQIGYSLVVLTCGALSFLSLLWALGIDVAPVSPAYGLEVSAEPVSEHSRLAYALTAIVFSIPLIPLGVAWYVLDRVDAFPPRKRQVTRQATPGNVPHVDRLCAHVAGHRHWRQHCVGSSVLHLGRRLVNSANWSVAVAIAMLAISILWLVLIFTRTI